MTETRPVAKPRVLALGFATGGLGLTLLLAIVIIFVADGWWRFLFILLPLAFAAFGVLDAYRAGKQPDERIRT